MAEQSTYVPGNLPVDGNTATAASASTDLVGLINEFNKQVPMTKLSADQAWTVFATTWGGFSANPTATVRYVKMGRTINLMIDEVSAGTSNSGTFSFTLPYPSNNTVVLNVGRARDNGSYITATVPVVVLVAGSSTANIYKDAAGTAFTSSGLKAVDLGITYESTS